MGELDAEVSTREQISVYRASGILFGGEPRRPPLTEDNQRDGQD